MMRRSVTTLFLFKKDLSYLTDDLVVGNFIDGKFGIVAKGREIIVSSPSNEKQLKLRHALFSTTAVEVDVAVGAARHCYESTWKHSTPEMRSNALRHIASLIRENATRLAQLDSLSCGLCLADSKVSMESCASCFDFFASIVWSSQGKVLPSVLQGSAHSTSVLQPLGVWGLITPFNYPLEMGVWKIAPAIAAGNTVVWKPPEVAPLSGILLSKLLGESSADVIPKGLINIVHGYGNDCGAALCGHPDVDGVSFTGSIPAGKAVQVSAAQSNLKRVNLELGGNAPAIVAADYDLQKAATALVTGCFTNSGQSCTSTRRIFVPKEKHMEFLEIAGTLAAERKLGHALDIGVTQGPMIDGHPLNRAMEAVDDAVKKDNAAVVVGNFRPTFPCGYFLAPTIITGMKHTAPIVANELFAPVMCVVPYDTIDDAIKMANDSKYGLSANAFTNHIDLARRFSTELHAGTVWINGVDAMNGVTPFGGVKMSGYGKDLGEASLASYSNVKTITTVVG